MPPGTTPPGDDATVDDTTGGNGVNRLGVLAVAGVAGLVGAFLLWKRRRT
jgi:hypothetical protein